MSTHHITPSLRRFALWASAVLLLSGCASVAPDGLRSAALAAAEGRTAGVTSARLASTDPQATQAARQAIAGWLQQPLTADRAVRIALLNNAQLQASLAGLGLQDADRVQALTLPNPQLTLGRLKNGHEREIERGLSFGLIDLLTLPWRSRWQGQALEQATLTAAQDIARTATDTRRAWLRAVAAEQVLAAHERMHEAADAGAELARRMVRVGNWSRLQQAREQATLADTRAQLAQTRLAAATEREQLNVLLGLWGPDTAYRLADQLPTLPTDTLPAEGLEARALRERLDVRAARLEWERVADEQGLSGPLHWLGDIGLGYSRNTSTEHASGHSDVQRGWELNLPLPLFDWGGAASARAQAVTLQSAARLQHMAVQARSEVRSRWLAYRTTWDLAQKHRSELLPLRQFIQDETLLRYNGMLASVWELLAEARNSTQAVAQAVQAERDFWLAEADLQFALSVASTASAPASSATTSSSPSSTASH